MKGYCCEVCGMDFSTVGGLRRHMQHVHKNVKPYERPIPIDKQISQSISFKYCEQCKFIVDQSEWNSHIRTNGHKKNAMKSADGNHFQVMKTSFKNRIQTLVYQNPNENVLSPELFFEKLENPLLVELKRILEKSASIKFNIELYADYMKMCRKDDGENSDCVISIKSFQPKMEAVLNENELQPAFKSNVEQIIKKMQEFQERDSGWTLVKIVHCEININEYKPLRGTKYLRLPPFVANKKACLNVKNDDEYCFKWSIISALSLTERRPDRTSSYEITDISQSIIHLTNGISLEFTGLEFPLKVTDVKKFEDLNSTISVNVFGFEPEGNKIIGPYYHTKNEKTQHINLLLIDNVDGNYHYVWIKNLSRLIKLQQTRRKSLIFICNTCLQHFYTEGAHLQHKNECGKIVTTMVDPEKAILEYQHYERQLDVPFVMYADFECILQDIYTCFPDPKTASTTAVQEHVPCAFSYFIKCSFDSSLDRLRVYKGQDSPKKFINSLINDVKWLYSNYIMKPKPIPRLTIEELEIQSKTVHCHICNKKLGTDRVIDHCHLTGKYRGPAHNQCNLLFRVPKFFPILLHNFSGYDCHLFIKELNEVDGDISVIPLNKELYVSLSKRIRVDVDTTIELRFLDSFRFMQSSLDNLARNLPPSSLKTVRSFFNQEEKFSLLTRKGVFPYEYISSWTRLDETSLPPRLSFSSKLTNSECNENDYIHAQKVWNEFECKTLWDYLELYLKTDVLLLADVFENFRKVCKTIYKLDPCQYYTAPGLAWDAMLKMTSIKLELLTDINIYNFVKRGIRGGITQCSHRHSIANNRYMGDYSNDQPDKYIVYLDANNLYGWAMSQPLPQCEFEWVENVDEISICDIPKDSDIGYIFEVDLEYPSSLHDSHNDLPFCAECKAAPGSSTKKLITDLNNKYKYVIHYRNLQQCIENGLKVIHIHRILKFRQSCWLKTYIDLNNSHRTLSKNSFEKNFFKLMNNAVFGKTMENVDKRKDVKIVTEWESRGRHLGARALIAKPNFHSATIFIDNMIAVQMNRVHTCYNKPIYLGFSILDISKLKMFDFHYSYMKPKFGRDILLNYMDTDSFIYTIHTKDFYKDILEDIDTHFDTSEYIQDNPYSIPQRNCKVLGMMKDETCGKIIREFVGLRSKMYSLSIINDKEIKKAKGVKKTVVDGLNLDDYRDCLYKKKIFRGSMYMFRSRLHQIYTECVTKISLSYLDDKRLIRSDKVSTYAWGHCNILN